MGSVRKRWRLIGSDESALEAFGSDEEMRNNRELWKGIIIVKSDRKR